MNWSNEVKLPKLLMAFGAAILVSGCSSVPSVTDSITEVKESLATDSLPFFQEPKKLTEEQVTKLFIGNTVESHNLNTGLNSITYYHPNGQAVQQRLWSQRLGKWAIEDDGKICLAFGDRSMKCRHIIKDDDRFFKVRPDADGNLQKIVRYRYFAIGNRLQDSH